jgi:toxin CptA
VSSRIDIRLCPAGLVGAFAALPWLVLAGFVSLLSADGQVWLLAMIPLAAVGASHAVRSHGLLLGQHCVVGLRLHDGQLWALHHDNAAVAVNPGPGSRIGARFSVLQLRQVHSNRYYTTVLLLSGCHGNLPSDDARRLRLWLRLGQKPIPTTV